jgi:hypothetical protein
MFEKNTLTFNPGWDRHAEKLDTFTDVRELQKPLKGATGGVNDRGGEYDAPRKALCRWIHCHES